MCVGAAEQAVNTTNILSLLEPDNQHKLGFTVTSQILDFYLPK